LTPAIRLQSGVNLSQNTTEYLRRKNMALVGAGTYIFSDSALRTVHGQDYTVKRGASASATLLNTGLRSA
jgi:hypothetical protein